MSQTFFAAATAPSLVSLDANFTDLYPVLDIVGNTKTLRYVNAGILGVNMSGNAIGGSGHSIALTFPGANNLYGMGFLPSADNTVAMTFANAANNRVGFISLTSSATTYNSASDRRLKCAIEPAAESGALIDAVEVVSHRWLNDGDPVRFGFIAQDLHGIFPEAVYAGDSGDEVKETWGVDPSKMVALLVKEVQSLRARVAALEAR